MMEVIALGGAPVGAPAQTPVAEAFRELRAQEFGRLDVGGHVYLDYTGSALYPESLVRGHYEWLRASVLGNPHSRNPTARASTELVEKVRTRVLEFFGADPGEYDAIFTSNATAALKLVGEAYPFGAGSSFRLTADNHNSVNGIREYAARGGADVRYLRLGTDLRIADLERQLAGADRDAPNLFAYPAQSNFSGVKHPLEWIELARDLGYDVMLDAADFVPLASRPSRRRGLLRRDARSRAAVRGAYRAGSSGVVGPGDAAAFEELLDGTTISLCAGSVPAL